MYIYIQPLPLGSPVINYYVIDYLEGHVTTRELATNFTMHCSH